MTKLDSILNSRDITLVAKVHPVKAMIFPVVMYGCEYWTMMKAEQQRIHIFELWCWRRLLGVLWTTRRSNQSILKEISPEYSLKGLVLKLKLQHLGHLMQRADSLGKKPDAGKDWRQKETGMTEDEMIGWHHQLNGHECEQTPETWGHKESDTTEQLNNNKSMNIVKSQDINLIHRNLLHSYTLTMKNQKEN